MALTESTMMMELGAQAPAFSVPDVTTGTVVTLETFTGKQALLVMFICRHCPYVQHIKEGLRHLDKDYVLENVGIVAISSNDAEHYQDDSPASLKTFVAEQHYHFPFCYDESQEVAKTYTAACTPDFFLFDANRRLVYRGQLDDSRPGNGKPVTGADLRRAIDGVLDGLPALEPQRPSIGCNIKWKAGNEPAYFGGK